MSFFEIIQAIIKKVKDFFKKTNTLPILEEPEPVEKSIAPIAYVSEFQELINKFNINVNSSYAFFDLIDAIIIAGKDFAKNTFKNALERYEDITSKADGFIKEYEKLESDLTLAKLDFAWHSKDENTEPIFLSAILDWAKEFGLEQQLQTEPRKIFELIIKEKLYQYGINSELKRIEVKEEFIEKNLREHNSERVEELMNEVLEEIETIN